MNFTELSIEELNNIIKAAQAEIASRNQIQSYKLPKQSARKPMNRKQLVELFALAKKTGSRVIGGNADFLTRMEFDQAEIILEVMRAGGQFDVNA